MMDSISQELLEAAQIITGDAESFTPEGKLIKKSDPFTDFFMGQYFQVVLGHKLESYPTTLKVCQSISCDMPLGRRRPDENERVRWYVSTFKDGDRSEG